MQKEKMLKEIEKRTTTKLTMKNRSIHRFIDPI